MTGTATNRRTGKTRVVTMSLAAATLASDGSLLGVCRAADGCRVEPDGECEHGWPSKLLALGLI